MPQVQTGLGRYFFSAATKPRTAANPGRTTHPKFPVAVCRLALTECPVRLLDIWRTASDTSVIKPSLRGLYSYDLYMVMDLGKFCCRRRRTKPSSHAYSYGLYRYGSYSYGLYMALALAPEAM